MNFEMLAIKLSQVDPEQQVTEIMVALNEVFALGKSEKTLTWKSLSTTNQTVIDLLSNKNNSGRFVRERLSIHNKPYIVNEYEILDADGKRLRRYTQTRFEKLLTLGLIEVIDDVKKKKKKAEIIYLSSKQ